MAFKFNPTTGKFDLVSDPATTTKQGIVKLANDLGGTADAPTVVATHLGLTNHSSVINSGGALTGITGVSGQVLTSNGSTIDPSFQQPTLPAGAYSNLRTVKATATTVTITWDSIVVGSWPSNNQSFTLDISSAGSINQLDKGARANNIWYHMYAVVIASNGIMGTIASPLANTAGTGATVSYTGAGGVITAVTATAPAGGSGYQVGDIVRVTSGDGTALVKVASVSGTAVATWSTTPVYAGAASYTTATGQATTVTPTLPTGYSSPRYLGAFYYTSNAIVKFYQFNQNVYYLTGYQALTNQHTSTNVFQTLDLSAFIPMTATEYQANPYLVNVTVATAEFDVSPDGVAFDTWVVGIVGSQQTGFGQMAVTTPQTVSWRTSTTTDSANLYIRGYSFNL